MRDKVKKYRPIFDFDEKTWSFEDAVDKRMLVENDTVDVPLIILTEEVVDGFIFIIVNDRFSAVTTCREVGNCFVAGMDDKGDIVEGDIDGNVKVGRDIDTGVGVCVGEIVGLREDFV